MRHKERTHSGCDDSAIKDLGKLLADLNSRESVTLITVTHSPGLAARMGSVLELRDGQLHDPGDGR